ncbi:MAG: tannase/feruloyl esterase family alpha/beta hydrolase, partial [Betaproteobacteria bacterium]|nr:tannase/feruloyl esterase family alpha/beta hydrolase [Betaproteobacteria bacterium]NDC86920.1 tannase/feruloyl esterase family alpha/beta hydrolase [Betaproteobacteria bacterium]
MTYTTVLRLKSRRTKHYFLLCSTLVLFGCSGDGSEPIAVAPVIELSCGDLAAKRVEAASIGLPTGGAIVQSASIVAAGAPGNNSGEYCKVSGVIASHSSTPSTPEIKFQLNLPVKWNGKALQMGGGGYNGTVVTGLDFLSMAFVLPPSGNPLSQGYATFGSDSGHVGNAIDASFAQNDGAVLNFGHEHLKKTRDVAVELIRLRYGKALEKVYFAGASTGGREGLTAAQRYPNDYDGIIANAPAVNFVGVRLHGIKVGQSVAAPGGFLNNAKQKLVLKTAVDACDSDDGLADRIVSNVEGCRTKQAAILAALRCSDGSDKGDTCLSDAQIATILSIQDDLVLPYSLAHNITRHQGYNILQGADFSGATLGLGSKAPVLGVAAEFANGYLFFQGDGFLKFFITRDPVFQSLGFNVAAPGQYEQQLRTTSGIVGATNPDLSGFRARKGKLILMHGLADEVISPNPTIAYYKDQVSRLGQETVDTFVRFYTVPGFGHGTGVFNPAWDALGALDQWVTAGVDPGSSIVATDTNGATFGRSR